MNHNLSAGEFQRAMQALERSINTRFDSVDDRLSELQDERAKQSERIAVLEAADKKSTRRHVRWGAVAASGAMLVFQGIKKYILLQG